MGKLVYFYFICIWVHHLIISKFSVILAAAKKNSPIAAARQIVKNENNQTNCRNNDGEKKPHQDRMPHPHFKGSSKYTFLNTICTVKIFILNVSKFIFFIFYGIASPTNILFLI
jgi:hypothetical protein